MANHAAAKLDDVTRILSDLKADYDVSKLSTQRMLPTRACRIHMLIG